MAVTLGRDHRARDSGHRMGGIPGAACQWQPGQRRSGSGIDKTRSVSGEDPTNADVVGGALTAGGPAVPWAIFRQQTSGHDQAFVRAFAGGAWSTKGVGTVAGKSSAAPTFPGSLNFDQAQDAEAPAIDFAGAGRTVPWATWYEATGAFGGVESGLRESLRQHRRREPGQVAVRRPEPRHRHGRRARPVAQHPHEPGRREPVGRRRLDRRPDEAGAMGHVAGDGRARQAGRIRSSSRSPSVRDRSTAPA